MIGLVTVNYNQYKLTREFLDSLSKVKESKNICVFIADVSTKNESFKTISYPMKVILKKLPNRGYAFGINQGVKYFLKNEITQFCAINNDVFFDKNFFIESKKGFQKSNIFGGKIYYAPGYEYHKKYKKDEIGNILWYAGGINDWKNVFTTHRGVDQVDRGQFDKFQETDFITGCMLFFDKNVVDRIGLWNENYFLYFEDSDYCERAKRGGFKLFYNPKIIIYHKNAQSTGGSGSPLHSKYQRKNRLVFGLKYAPLRTKIHLIKNYLLDK
ncbi:glycosyltransferase family 2 protein [Candidatus Roizmanbacteria bacterium]|nr:glycosyltransferase family 2 protein [Candidatus Roizmanbacteria bacterium]